MDNRKQGRVIERYVKDLEEIQLDWDYQVTKWFQGSEKEIIFRISVYLNQILNEVMPFENLFSSQYTLTELTISTSLKRTIERKMISSEKKKV